MLNILKIEAYDRPGVLNRLCGLIRRKGWNIDSLSAASTMREGISEVNFSLSGKGLNLASLGDYLSELDVITHWEICQPEEHVLWESIILKVPTSEAPPALFDLREISTEDGFTYLEFSGPPQESKKLVAELAQHRIPYTRTGVIALRKGGVS